MKSHKRYYCAVVFLLVTMGCLAQYFPHFENHSLSEYKAGNQNWDVSVAESGKLYVANNNGLLVYDGLVWQFFELPNKTTIRSVLAVDDKIYTGSYEEFGYWYYSEKGELLYHSLTHLLEKQTSTSEEFWQILQHNESIVYRSFLNLYVYKNGTISKLKPPSTVLSVSKVGQTIYVATLRHGIYKLTERNELVPFIDGSTLSNTKIIALDSIGGGLLITTALQGCYMYKNGSLFPFDSEINPLLKEHQLNGFAKLPNGNLLFGTIKNGIYVSDPSGRVVYNVNKEDGLANNTVLGMTVANDRVWLGLDDGLASMDLSGQNWFYNDVSGELGAVYDVVQYQDKVYVGSNTGLFSFGEDGELNFIDGSQGQVWDLYIVNDELLCGHNNGTYKVKNGRLQLISGYTGGWVTKKIPEHDAYIQGTYGGLVKLESQNGKWNAAHMRKTTMPIRFLVFEDPYTAWVAHAYKGLYRAKFDKHHDSIVSLENYANKGLASSYNVRVYKIKNDICFKVNNGWQKYEPLLDSIVPFKFLNDRLGKDSYIISEEGTEILAVKKENAIDFSSFSDQGKFFALGKQYFDNRLVVGYENVSQIKPSTYALSLNNGFMLLDGKASVREQELQQPMIEKLLLNNQLQPVNESSTLTIGFRDSLSVVVSSAKSKDFFFEYALTSEQNTIKNWQQLEKNVVSVSELKPDNYTFYLRAKNDQGEVSPTKTILLEVTPPWFRDTLGFVLYIALAILLIGIFYLLHLRKVKKEQALLHKKYVHKQQELLKEKAMENEKHIIELKNQALQREVKLKSKQLANTAMALVKKNETLQELKSELLEHKNELGNYYSLKKLVKKVDYSMAHDDEWEIFEHNFNQVHEAFFNKLKAHHPKISQKDLRLCAYIKMGLLTKEIAPLMNISVRGVETHRYRLKKRLNLESGNSLTDYLSNID